MSKTQRSLLTLCVCVALLFSTSFVMPVSAGGVYATEFTQLFNYAELGDIEYQNVQQLIQQVQQTQMQLQNMQQLDQWIVNQVKQEIQAAGLAVQVGNGLAYNMSNLDSEWNTVYQGAGYKDTGNYQQQYTQISQSTMDSIKGTLNAVNAQGTSINSDAANIDDLQNLAKSNVKGTEQALEALLQISAATASELVKMRQLMLADLQSKEAWQAQQVSLSQAGQQVGVMGPIDSSVTNYDSSTQFPESFFQTLTNAGVSLNQ